MVQRDGRLATPDPIHGTSRVDSSDGGQFSLPDPIHGPSRVDSSECEQLAPPDPIHVLSRVESSEEPGWPTYRTHHADSADDVILFDAT